MSVALPITEIDKFAELFALLDTNKADFRIESFGVTLTTLEEVCSFFLNCFIVYFVVLFLLFHYLIYFELGFLEACGSRGRK